MLISHGAISHTALADLVDNASSCSSNASQLAEHARDNIKYRVEEALREEPWKDVS